ncbi:hypothetical protein V8E36_003146 [Tilletia maclaganii]
MTSTVPHADHDEPQVSPLLSFNSSTSPLDYLDDIIVSYRDADVERLWNLVPDNTLYHALGAALVSFALKHQLIDYPEAWMLGDVNKILNSPSCDPWTWTLQELNRTGNAIRPLNSMHDPLHFQGPTFTRANINHRHCITVPSRTVTSITARLQEPHRSLLPKSVTDDKLEHDLLQHVKIFNAGTILGPVPGGAPLCCAVETQIIGHRLIFEWPRDEEYSLPRDAFSASNINDTLFNMPDLCVYLMAPGMALDADNDVVRIVVILDISSRLRLAPLLSSPLGTTYEDLTFGSSSPRGFILNFWNLWNHPLLSSLFIKITVRDSDVGTGVEGGENIILSVICIAKTIKY